MPAESRTHAPLPENYVVLAVALLVVAIAAFRATIGVSFYDDSHYVTVALRLAEGARPFADEMSVQSLGFLPAAAFVWIWTHLVGITGLVTAFRVFYVVLATAVGGFAFAELRRTYHPAVAALPIVVVLLCPPFNLLAPGYNLMATLGLVVATALGHRALLDDSIASAIGTGLALAFASITYPPLTLAALVFVGTFAILGRNVRLTVWLVGACALAISLFVAALLSRVSIAEIRYGLSYASDNVAGIGSPAAKIRVALSQVLRTLDMPALWPMWLVTILASLPRVPDKARGWLLLALAPLALVPSVPALASHQRVFGITASAWLITFVLGAFVPTTLWAAREKRRDLVGFLALTIPASLVGFLTVVYSTDSGWLRAVPVIGLTPMAIAVLATWASALESLNSEATLVVGASLAVVIAMGMLWATTMDDATHGFGPKLIDHGAYAGMRTSASHSAQLAELELAASRWVRPDTSVTFFGERQGYLATGGRIYTNAVWLYPARTDVFALKYFAAHGGEPDVVFTDQYSMSLHDLYPYDRGARTDRFVALLLRDYRLVDVAADFGVWVRQ